MPGGSGPDGTAADPAVPDLACDNAQRDLAGLGSRLRQIHALVTEVAIAALAIDRPLRYHRISRALPLSQSLSTRTSNSGARHSTIRRRGGERGDSSLTPAADSTIWPADSPAALPNPPAKSCEQMAYGACLLLWACSTCHLPRIRGAGNRTAVGLGIHALSIVFLGFENSAELSAAGSEDLISLFKSTAMQWSAPFGISRSHEHLSRSIAP